MDLSKLGGGGGWKTLLLSDTQKIVFNLVGERLRVTPAPGQSIRLNVFNLYGGGATVVSFGGREVFNEANYEPLATTGGGTYICGNYQSRTQYIEGKEGEELVVYTGALSALFIGALIYEIGEYA